MSDEMPDEIPMDGQLTAIPLGRGEAKGAGTPEWVSLIFEKLYRASMLMFNEDGESLPVIHAYTADNKEFMIPLAHNSDEAKDRLLTNIRFFFAENNVVRYFVVTEAWAAKYDKDDPVAGSERPSEAMHRVETFLIQYCSYESVEMRAWRIVRDTNGEYLRLEKEEPMWMKEECSQFKRPALGGNMMELLPDPRMAIKPPWKSL